MPVNSLTLLLSALLTGLVVQAGAQTPAADASNQSLAAVRLAAEAALRRELDPNLTGVHLAAADLDPRLRLPACGAPLVSSATLPRGAQSRVLVRVACKTQANWNLNVPVEISRTTDVLVMRRAVGRGESIGAADVVVQSRVLPGLASPYVARIADLSGRLTRRPIPEGTALPADALQPALLIHRGQSVTLASSGAGLEVRAPGLAMADAAANQRVRVQNLNSLKIVEGVADTDGVVRVAP
ncbi:MAG: flagellar basal body P-ring formation chaperone FlgA [Pseudomonadota bacterium]